MSKVNDTSEPTISEQITELDTLLAWFDSDDFTIEAAFDRYKEAEKLASAIEQRLLVMKNDINVLKKRFDEA